MSSDVRQRLLQQIREWNINRLDLFALSEPNQDLEFFGVMRFFYQDEEEKVSTKCVRVSSTATTKDVLDILIEKFRPDLRMLSRPLYALYEVHINGEERKLSELECPLLVQLNWGKDDREGRFLLKRESDKTTAWSGLGDSSNTAAPAPDLERRLSKREKKELKKLEKEAQRQESHNKENIAKRLYEAAPDSSFTRSISNPEMVMRRRRQMKLERKLQQIRSSDDGPNSGGTLKIYGETICPEVPYKTLLLSMNDTVAHVVRETLDKYGLEREDAHRYCLMQVVQPSDAQEFYGKHRQEFLLEDDDYPLEILTDIRPNSGPVTFHLVRRPANAFSRQADLPPGVSSGETDKFCPCLLELNPDGTKPYDARSFPVPRNGLELGQEKSPGHNGSFLKLVGSDICRQHCAVEYVNGAVVIMPLDRSAAVRVDNSRIYSATPLSHGASVLVGSKHLFQFVDPMTVQKRMGTSLADDYPQNMFGTGEHTGAGSPNMDVLPATVEYRDDAEDDFVRLVLTDINVDALEFKLTPTYVVYMAVRHTLMHGFRPHADHKQRAHNVAALTTKVANMTYRTIQRCNGDALALAVWMANSSEMLHFFSCDVDLAAPSVDAQNILAECVQHAFLLLVDALQNSLHQTMPAFVSTNPDVDSAPDDVQNWQSSTSGPRIDDVVNLLSWTMSLLLRARVNAALTIQLFSQLFHFINQWLFNRLIAHNSTLCTRATGQRLRRRLHRVEMWAEKQGLELAAECHLARVMQAAVLLESQKATPDVVADLSSSCFKLNSLQLRALLQNYKPARDELPISPELIERAALVAQNTADAIARREGSEVKLLEDLDLQLPFLLPEDGYSCDFVSGCNAELVAFLEPLRQAGICRIVEHPQSSGKWNVFLSKPRNVSGRGAFPVMEPASPAADHHSQLPQHLDLLTVTFDKVKNSIGLSIIEAVGEGQRDRSIYVKYVIPDGAAARDGRLEAGDQLLEVDGTSLVGLSQEQAANIMKSTGQSVTLKVAKRAALHHGLGTLLEQPSPQVLQHGDTLLPLNQPSGVQPSYQPRQQQQLYAEPHYAIPRSSQYAMQQVPHADQRESQYDRQQPGYRQHEMQEQPRHTRVPQQSSWQQPHPAYDRQYYDQQHPPPRRESQNQPQPAYSAQPRHQYEPQYQQEQQQQQAPYHQQHGRIPSAFEPSYTDPHLTRDAGRIPPGRSKSASDLNQPEMVGAWPTQPSLQYGHGHQPPFAQEPLSSWKSYEGPGQRGLASSTGMQEPVKIDRRQFETTNDGRQVSPDTQQYAKQMSVPDRNRQVPYWQESDRRSQPQLNVTKQQNTATRLSHPELTGSHHFVEPARDAAPFTSNDLLRRAQPSQQGVTSPTPFTHQVPTTTSASQGTLERRSVPVGGHLRAIDPKNVHQMAPVMPPTAVEHSRPQSYHKTPSQSSAPAESTYMKPAERSQSLSRTVPPPSGPWERARKEEEMKHVELEQRRRREEEIRHLESLLPDQLSPAEIDRLRRLKLNAEFDRRATELERTGDHVADSNTDMTPAGRAQVAHYLHQEIDEKRRQMQQQLDMRDRQLIEANRAKAEFEERQRQQQLQSQREHQKKMDLQLQEQQILESEELLRNQMGTGSVQYRVYQPERNMNNNNDSDAAPPPPERTSSFGMYQSAAAAKKMVSFQPSVSVQENAAGNGSDIAVSHADTATPNRLISASSAPPTPGVVGAQELYPDPRDRMRSSNQEPYYMTPDRMTFVDKMRRFAAEAGEDTPLPKAKISRAQQRIEVEH